MPRAQAREYLYEDRQWLLEQVLRAEYGLVRDVSVSAVLPFFEGFMDEPTRSGGRFGLGDLELDVQYRFVREDLGPVDTFRVAGFGGMQLPSATNGFGSSSVCPFVGIDSTLILGRNGLDASARWTFVTNDGGLFVPSLGTSVPDDFANVDVGYAFRLYPEEYGEERVGAWYATLEMNDVFTTGGMYQLALSPGLLLEAPSFALELGVQVPFAQGGMDGTRMRIAFTAGVRFQF